jgi:hypothetical protein
VPAKYRSRSGETWATVQNMKSGSSRASVIVVSYLALSIQIGRRSSQSNSEEKEVSHTNLGESPKCGLSRRRWSSWR